MSQLPSVVDVVDGFEILGAPMPSPKGRSKLTIRARCSKCGAGLTAKIEIKLATGGEDPAVEIKAEPCRACLDAAYESGTLDERALHGCAANADPARPRG